MVVAAYFGLRLLWSSFSTVTCPGHDTRLDRMCDLAHLAMCVAMAVMFSEFSGAVPPAAGILVFAGLGAWFVVIVRRHGATGRSRGIAGSRSYGGYALHHLMGCAAMVYMYGTGHPDQGAHVSGAAAAHHVALFPAVSTWLLALYFLVATASLGFTVGMAPSGGPAWRSGASLPAVRRSGAARRLLAAPAGLVAADVAMSAAMATMLFGAV